MESILKIAKKKNITVIEDCAQSQGAKFKKRYSGTFGKFGCFSFYPTKIFGAYGDGGFITTNNETVFDRMRRIRFLGMEIFPLKTLKIKRWETNRSTLVCSRLGWLQ